MTQKPSNTAAWLNKGSKSLEVGPAPYTVPTKGQLVVKTLAVALNPIDYSIPIIGSVAFPWMKFPCVTGTDVSGTVVEVGEGVTRFKVGDRVVGYAQAYDKETTGAPEGAFQAYVAIRERFCSPIPETMTFADASVIPLGCGTALGGLFGKEYCALDYPTMPARASNGQTFLVWGGSTSVGCNAIQLAVAAGYQVITTASPKNFELVKSLGASHAFDYRSPTVTKDIISVLKNTKCAGAIAIGQGSAAPCIDIIAAVPSVGRKFVAQASTPGGPPTKGGVAMVGFVATLVTTNASLAIRSRVRGVASKFMEQEPSASPLWDALYKDFLPLALEQNTFKPAPAADIYGKGLETINAGFESLISGVSAKKLVIALE